MTPEQLKASILQYAIQGKLVEQRPEEGTAEDLHKAIQKEKQKLIKEGKIKKEKPLDAITEDDIPFDIPDCWKWVRLGNLITVQNGYSYKPEETNKNGIGLPVIKSGNVMSLKVELKARNDFVENPSEKMLNSKIIKGDMLMCLSSQSYNPEPLGKTAIYEWDTPALLNQRVLKMRACFEDITKYLYYVINSEYFHYTVSHQGGGSAQANLKMEHVLGMLVPLPPIEEQHRIVAKIEELLPFVNRYAASYEKLEQFNAKFPEDMKKSILQYAIQGKLVEQRAEEGNAEELYAQIQAEKQQLIKDGKIKKSKPLPPISEDEIPFDIPNTWLWVNFGDIVNYSMGKTPPRAEPVWWDNDVNWVSISDMSDYGYVKETKEKVSNRAIEEKFGKISKAGTLLMSFKLTVGRTSILDIDAVHNEAIISIFPYFDYENSFRNYLFNILPLITQGGESKNAIKGKTLNSKSISELKIPLPPLAEQKRIVEKIEELLALCDKLK